MAWPFSSKKASGLIRTTLDVEWNQLIYLFLTTKRKGKSSLCLFLCDVPSSPVVDPLSSCPDTLPVSPPTSQALRHPFLGILGEETKIKKKKIHRQGEIPCWMRKCIQENLPCLAPSTSRDSTASLLSPTPSFSSPSLPLQPWPASPLVPFSADLCTNEFSYFFFRLMHDCKGKRKPRMYSTILGVWWMW